MGSDAAEAAPPGAAEETEEERLDLILLRVGRDDAGGADLVRDGTERSIARVTRAYLEPRPRRQPDRTRDDRNAELRPERVDAGAVRGALGAAESMIDVSRGQPEAARGGELDESPEERR